MHLTTTWQPITKARTLPHCLAPAGTWRLVCYLLLQYCNMPFTYSNIEYSDMIFIYGFCNGNASAAAEEYRRRYQNRRHPDARVFYRVHQHLREKGTFPGIRATAERVGAGDDGHARGIVQMIRRSPRISTGRLSSRLGFPRTTVWRTLRKEGLHPYHLNKAQHLKPEDYEKRLSFCQWLEEQPQLCPYILYTDESTFTRDGTTNLHNEHWWAEENPHKLVQCNFQERFSVSIWCGIIDDLLIGPHIFERRLTGEIYENFLRHELPRLLRDVPVHTKERMILQQDGAPPHSSRQVKEYLDTAFPEKWIGRGGPHQWPARSPDLTPLDFFLWGHMKSLVYKEKPESRDDLILRIMDAAEQIRIDKPMLKRVTTSVLDRARKCIECGGCHFEHLL